MNKTNQRLTNLINDLKELSNLENLLSQSKVECKNGQYSFPNLPYYNGTVDVQFIPEFIKNSQGTILYNRVSDWWRQYRKDTGKVLLDIQMLYQIGRRLMHAEQTKEVQECATKLRRIFDANFISGAITIDYKGGLEAEIEGRDIDGKKRTKTVQVPEFTKDNPNDNWTYLVLAKRQTASQLGTVESIPENAKQFLKALLGESYEEVGAVFQYLCTPHDNGDLREVRQWVPVLKNRPNKRAVVLGFNDYGFYIGCIINYGPALSVVVRRAQKIFSGNKGIKSTYRHLYF